MRKVQEECANKVVFQCSAEGEPQPEEAKKNCYASGSGDRGCGHPCIDEVLETLNSH